MVVIDERDLTTAHRNSLHNRQLLARGGQCGCFHCLKNFDAVEVIEWATDGTTALCPYCHIDAVLSSQTDPVVAIFLTRMHEFWFGSAETIDLSAEIATRA